MQFLLLDNDQACVDDLRAALEQAVPGCGCACFTEPDEALRYARDHPLNAAFLEAEFREQSGIAVAAQLQALQPALPIIFVAANAQYAVSAFGIHASGYLLKPVRAAALHRELAFLYGTRPTAPVIQVKTFGGFEVMVGGRPLVFHRAKSKELLACLIDRRGAGLTTREACSLLWEDGVYNTARKNYFQTVVHGLRQTLQQAGIGHLLVKTHNSIAIRPELLDCDSYRFLDGDPQAVNSYRHNYLPSYSWAEFTVGKMERY